MKKLIVFDLDGTLLNTLLDLTEAVNHALALFNYPLRTDEQIRKAIGDGVKMLIQRSVPDGENNPNKEEVLKEFRKYYQAHYNVHTKRYDGMLEALNELKALGFTLAVVTNKIDPISKDLMNYYYKGIFSYVLGDTPMFERKPNPKGLEFVINKLGFTKEETAYVGDTNVDYQLAKNAKVDILLVTYGFRSEEELKSYGIISDNVKSPKDIILYFKGVNNL